MKEKPKYWQMVKDEESDSADLYIFGDIVPYGKWYDDDPDRSATNILNEIKDANASKLRVHINSLGGDVSEGLAIYNTLKAMSNVTTICDGFACSAASVIFMAGGERVMNPASVLMVHNAWTFSAGNSEELRKAADDLDVINDASKNAYRSVMTISEDDLTALMDGETWISANDAMSYGFATKIADQDVDSAPKQSALNALTGKLLQKSTEYDAVMTKLDEIFGAVKPKEDPQKAPDTHNWKNFF